MKPLTVILHRLDEGDSTAAEDLLPLVYSELRALAAVRLAQEPSGQTLQATALVHEAWLRLVDVDQQQQWDSRDHFFAAAAEAMRRILIENARRKGRLKHGGGYQRVSLGQAEPVATDLKHDVLAVDEVLQQLEKEDPQKAALVKLRYFAGFNLNEAAAALGISRATASRHWAYARAWLYDRLLEP